MSKLKKNDPASNDFNDSTANSNIKNQRKLSKYSSKD